MSFLLSVIAGCVGGYLGLHLGIYAAKRFKGVSYIDEDLYEYHGGYSEDTPGQILKVNSPQEYLIALSKVIKLWCSLNDINKDKEICIGRDNVLMLSFNNSTQDLCVQLYYKNMRYAEWVIDKYDKLIYYNRPALSINMINTEPILEWFSDEGVVSWRVRKEV